jgi:protein gp37
MVGIGPGCGHEHRDEDRVDAGRRRVGGRDVEPGDGLHEGVSVESQKWAAVRLDKLAAMTAGSVRFASCEPLLGPLDLRLWLGSGLEWVIMGGESGTRPRPVHPDWVRSIRDQCQTAGVAYLHCTS